MIVYWNDPTAILVLTPVWLYMGYAYALIVRKTGSLWGAVLAHAIADVILAVPEAVAAALDAGRKYINSLAHGGGA